MATMLNTPYYVSRAPVGTELTFFQLKRLFPETRIHEITLGSPQLDGPLPPRRLPRKQRTLCDFPKPVTDAQTNGLYSFSVHFPNPRKSPDLGVFVLMD